VSFSYWSHLDPVLVLGQSLELVLDIADAVVALQTFSGPELTTTLAQIESAIEGRTSHDCAPLLAQHNVRHDALDAAGLVKRMAGQIDVVIHALGILLCLPDLLQADEVIESLSLGAAPAVLERGRLRHAAAGHAH